MTKLKQMQKIEHSGVVAIIRASNPSLLIEVVDAIQAGGIDVIEITMTTPNALGVLEEAVTKFGDGILFGVGRKPVRCKTPSMEQADREQTFDPIY